MFKDFSFESLIPPIFNFKHKASTNETVITPSRILREIMRSVPGDAGLITSTGRSKLEETYGLQIFHEIASDAQVKAALSVKEAAIQTGKWTIRPYDDSEKAIKQAEMLTYCFKEMIGDVGIGLKPVVKAYRYGRSDCELTYEYIKNGKYAGYYCPKPLKPKNIGFMAYVMDDFDNIIGYKSKTLYGEEKDVPAHKIIHYAYESENSNPYGTSDLISCYPWYWAKKTLYKYMMIFCDKYASPVPVITTEKPLTQEAENKLDDAAKNYHISNFFKLPKGVTLEMFQSNGAGADVYIQAIREADSQMARGIFANTLTIGESDKSGTYAQAKVHKGTLKDLVSYNMNDLEENVMNLQLIPRIVDVNEANPEGYCTFHFDSVDSGELNSLADAIGKLVNCVDDVGNPVVHSQEPWIRRWLSIPERDLKKFPLNTELPEHLNPNYGKLDSSQQMQIHRDGSTQTQSNRKNDTEKRAKKNDKN